MKNLHALAGDATHISRYELIRDSKHTKTRLPLVAAHALVSQRYEDFEAAIECGLIDSLQKNHDAHAVGDHLRDCYKGSTKALLQLKQAISSAQPRLLLKYCPMCGMTLPRTFDHYLPSSEFPEFAVHGLNLVPCCAMCNSIKDNYWLSVSGKRFFLHAYSDELPSSQYLWVSLHQHPELGGVGATFELRRPQETADAQWELVESHFRRLRLVERYNDRGNDEVSEILGFGRVYQDTGGVDVKAFLSSLAARCRANHGDSFWIAILMQAIAEHPDLGIWVDGA